MHNIILVTRATWIIFRLLSIPVYESCEKVGLEESSIFNFFGPAPPAPFFFPFSEFTTHATAVSASSAYMGGQALLLMVG